jgi:hypothetical protein
VIAALVGILQTDSESAVRTGAVRSLVEVAARESSLRDQVFSTLLQLLPEIPRDEIERQLRRSLVLREPTPDWPQYVAPVLEWLWASAESLDLQDEWREFAYAVQKASGDAAA